MPSKHLRGDRHHDSPPTDEIAGLSTSTVSSTFSTPGCLKVRDFRTAFRASGSRDLLAAISKVKTLHDEPSSYMTNEHLVSPVCTVVAYLPRRGGRPNNTHTRFVALWRVQIESETSTLSPIE